MPKVGHCQESIAALTVLQHVSYLVCSATSGASQIKARPPVKQTAGTAVN